MQYAMAGNASTYREQSSGFAAKPGRDLNNAMEQKISRVAGLVIAPCNRRQTYFASSPSRFLSYHVVRGSD